MVDSVVRHLPRARQGNALAQRALVSRNYALLTLHRPSNVDNAETFAALLGAVTQISARVPVIFPVHPRTRARLAAPDLMSVVNNAPSLILADPLGYLDFLQLQDSAAVVLTDSGGIQEETTALGVPCLTLRENTERPITISEGTNTLVGMAPERIVASCFDILDGKSKRGRTPELWDGNAGERAANAIRNFLARR